MVELDKEGLRLATPEDAAGILSVYRPYVEATPISFETVSPTLEEMRSRISEYGRFAPWLVCVRDGRIAGYAYGSKHRERAAYAWSVEVSAYVASDFHRKGVGRALYANLLQLLKRQGFFNAFAGITLPNEPSVKLHEACGFRPLGTFKNVGFKLGRWHDVGWWQKSLRDSSEAPLPIGRPEDISPQVGSAVENI